MSKLKEIIEGHVNEFKKLAGLENEQIEKVSASRQLICNNCEMKLGNTCNTGKYINPITLETAQEKKVGFIQGCGCRLSAKQRSPDSSCPAGFWGKEFIN